MLDDDGFAGVSVRALGFGVRQRLADLAVVAVDREGLQAGLPALEVDLLDLFDRGGLGHVDRLGDRTREEGLHRGHHAHVAHRGDGALAHGRVEDGVVLGLEPRRVDDMAVFGDVFDDRLDGLVGVAQALERQRNRLVDDLHRTAAHELLELHQGEVRLHPGGVTVHHEADGAGGSEHRCLGIAPAVDLADAQALGPLALGDLGHIGVKAGGRAQGIGRCRVLAHDALVRIGVAGVALVGADDAGELGRAAVGRAGHHRRDGGGECAATLGVVGQAHGHEECAQVGVADAQLAVVARGAPDRLGREVGEADRDVHGRDDELHGATEGLGVERAVVLEELQQVERGEVAGRVVEAHVFGARVGRGDAAGLGVGVPVVDRVVVLDARIGAGPRGLAHLAEERLGVNGLDDLAGLATAQSELSALLNRAHELVGDAHGVIGVLVLHRGDV